MAHGIDFVLAGQPIRDGRLEVKELFFGELLLALPPSHPLTRIRALAVAGLEGECLRVVQEGRFLGDQMQRLHPSTVAADMSRR